MTNKEFILKLIKYCCFGLLLFAVFVLSFCCGFYYRDSGHIMQVNAQSVKLNTADVGSSTFQFKSMYIPVTCSSSNSTYVPIRSYVYNISVVLTDSSLSVTGLYPNFSNNTVNNTDYFDVTINNYNIGFDSQVVTPKRTNSGITANHFIYFVYNISSGFNFDVVKIRTLTSSYPRASIYDSSTIIFYDSNNLTFTLNFFLSMVSTDYDVYGFYLSDFTFLLTTSLNNNSAYQQGYSDGLSQGLSDNQQSIYDTGYNTGYNNGDLVGYQRGIEDSNQYTFLNLIGAVIDAPITAFVNLLDFNVFGFNMLNLCCSLLTLSLIILVVKFVLFRS